MKKHNGSRMFYRSFQAAKKWALESEIKTSKQWFVAKKPVDIPNNPQSVYSRPTICKCNDMFATIIEGKLVCIRCSL